MDLMPPFFVNEQHILQLTFVVISGPAPFKRAIKEIVASALGQVKEFCGVPKTHLSAEADSEIVPVKTHLVRLVRTENSHL